MIEPHGIIPPLLTPLAGPDALDTEGLARLIDHVVGGGVHGLFVLGTCGEAPSLSHRLKHETVEAACVRTAGRVPVWVGVSDTSWVETLALAEHAASCGASGVVLGPPYYYPIDQAALSAYLVETVSRLPLPVMLYNIPSHTKVPIEPETLRAAASQSGVVGFKDSSGNRDYFEKALAAAGDVSVLMGAEAHLAWALRRGARGGVPGGANIEPSLYVELYDVWRAGDEARLAELESGAQANSRRWREVGGGSVIAGLKAALAELGMCESRLAAPLAQPVLGGLIR